MKVIIYARISDRKQLDGASLETQVNKCTEYAQARNWHIVKVLQELHTGTEYRERKLLSEARDMIRNNEADIFLINSLDRLSRDQVHQAVLLEEIEHYNAKLVSVTEDIDNSSLGQFMRQALGFAAAVEREKFLERSKRTIEKRVKDGKMIGAGTPRYGYLYTEDHSKYILHPEESKVVKYIYKLRLEGYSIRRIAIILNQEGVKASKGGLWNITVVWRILSTPLYKGVAEAYNILYTRENGVRKAHKHPNVVNLPEGTVPAIISKEDFDAVQILLIKAKRESTRNNQDPQSSLLRAGYIRCGYCGNVLPAVTHMNLVGRRWDGGTYERKQQYRCSKANNPSQHCPGVSITAEIIDTIVWKYIGSLLNDLTDIKKALELLKGKQKQDYDVNAIQRSIDNAKKEQEQFSDDIKGLRGNARNMILKQMNDLEDRIEQLENEKAQAIPQATNIERQQQEIDTFLDWAEEMKGKYDETTYEEKRRALYVLGISVYLFKEKDKEHERYEIKVGLSELCSNISV